MAKRFAIVKNGRVDNVVMAEDALAASNGWLELTNGAKIGDIVEGNSIVSVVTGAITNNVSPIEFKLLFTPQERISIKTARQTDPLIDDLYDLIDDPRCTHVDLKLKSTKDAIDYLISQGHVDMSRKEEIFAGVLK